jgi:hypothetical protein
MERMAFAKAFYGKPNAFDGAMLFDCFIGILRTSRIKTTAAAKKRAESLLIKKN